MAVAINFANLSRERRLMAACANLRYCMDAFEKQRARMNTLDLLGGLCGVSRVPESFIAGAAREYDAAALSLREAAQQVAAIQAEGGDGE